MENQFVDKKVNCIDCGNEFIDRAKDQAFRYKQGWIDAEGTVTPLRRCFTCRQKRKTSRAKGGEKYESR